MGGAAFLRFYAGHSWIFTGAAALLVATAFYVSVLRRPGTGGRIAFLFVSLLVVGASFWPQAPTLGGWITAALAVSLAISTLILLIRSRAGRCDSSSP